MRENYSYEIIALAEFSHFHSGYNDVTKEQKFADQTRFSGHKIVLGSVLIGEFGHLLMNFGALVVCVWS